MSQISTTVVTTPKSKSVGVAILLTILFGPLGMLYSTVIGALVMMLFSVVVATLTLGIGLFFTWPVCIIWAAVAAGNANKETVSQVITTTSHQAGSSEPKASSVPPAAATPINSTSPISVPSHSISTQSDGPELLECPQCAESIKFNANICRFCNANIEDTQRNIALEKWNKQYEYLKLIDDGHDILSSENLLRTANYHKRDGNIEKSQAYLKFLISKYPGSEEAKIANKILT